MAVPSSYREIQRDAPDGVERIRELYESAREAEARDYFEKCGGKPRDYRNGVGLVVPSEDQIETLRRAVRYILAIENVRGKAKSLALTDAQKDQLKEREATERTAAESALLKLYTEVWLPRVEEGGGLGIEPVALGGRTLQSTLDEKRRAMIHQRIMELLDKKVFGSLTPTKIVDLLKLGEGTPPRLGIKTSEVVAGFYSFLGFPRLTTDAVIRRAVAHGVEKRVFGYTTGAPTLGPDGRFQIERAKVAFDRALPEDEVDLDAGFLIVPSALPAAASAPGPAPRPPGTPPGPTPPGPVPPGSGPTPPGGGGAPPGAGPQRTVELVFSADRNQLYTAWNALANLADLAGKVVVTVKAESQAGFDAGKLRNGVLEPLKETKLIE